ncbi:GW dipeptide domain-containing protein [Oenococcus oeni]|uniref:GW dipeptide domain-containing protein n=2 Tax=Oenococcus oeni TaxID=1247 RepID=UPI0010B68734|nr:GW dipeptide domain-containing protein [Oenococcus oeni]SYW13936.1 conserved exported hypothetical protein [Oenococcus oeni]
MSKCKKLLEIIISAFSLIVVISACAQISFAFADSNQTTEQSQNSSSSSNSNSSSQQASEESSSSVSSSSSSVTTSNSYQAKVTSSFSIDKTATINDTNRNDGVFYKGPALTSDDTMTNNDQGKNYDGHVVTVLQVASTVRNNGEVYNYVQVQDPTANKNYWIDQRAVLATVTDNQNTNYQARIYDANRNDWVLTNGPALTSWDTLSENDLGKNYEGHQVTVIKQAVTLRGNGNTYTYVEVNDSTANRTYWIDKRAISTNSYDQIISQQSVNKYAQVVGSRNDTIYNNGPALTSAYTMTGQGHGNNYLGQYVQVLEIDNSRRSNGLTYQYAKIYDTQTKQNFWIDIRSLAIADYATILSTTQINKTAVIRDSSRNDWILNNGPALTNATTLSENAQGKNYNGHIVTVLQAEVTKRGNIQYIYDQVRDGNQTYWIDQRAILATATYKNVNYKAIIDTINRSDGIYFNGPALTSWDTNLDANSDIGFNGRTVQVLQEAVTSRGDGSYYTYLKVQDGLKIYWLDKRAFLFPTQSTNLRYNLYNQVSEGAPEGCEGTSLQIALSVKGRYLSLHQIYNATGYGWNISPYNGFYGNPFGYGVYKTTTVYAAPLVRGTKKFDSGITDMTGATINDVIYQLQQGNPVITWASYSWTVNPFNFHVMCIVGYKPGYFRIADPYPYLFGSSYWIKTSTWYNVNHNETVVGFSNPRAMNVVVK